MKAILKGVIKEVGAIETVGEKLTKKQRIILFVPGYVDQFGEKKGRDEHWPLDVMGDNVAKLNLQNTAVKQKVECTVYISGNVFDKVDLSGVGYAINANLVEVKMLGEFANPAANPVTTTNTDNW
jgi:hypothetical protein